MEPGKDLVYRCPQCGNFLRRQSISSGNTFIATVYSDGKMIAPMLPEFPNLTKCKKCNSIVWLSDLVRITNNDSSQNKDSPQNNGVSQNKDSSSCGESKLLIKILSGIISGCITLVCNFFKIIYVILMISIGIFILLPIVGFWEFFWGINSPFWGIDWSFRKIGWFPSTAQEDREDRYVDFLGIEDLLRALEITNDKEKEKSIRIQIWWTFNDRVRKGRKIFVEENDKKLWEQNCYALLDLLDKNDTNQKVMTAELYRNLGQFDSCLELINSLPKKFDELKDKFTIECTNKNQKLFVLYSTH